MEATARSGARTPNPIENTIIAGKEVTEAPPSQRELLPKMSNGIVQAARIMLVPTSRKLRLVRTIIKLICAADISQRVRKKSVSEGSSMKMTKLTPGTIESSVAN